MEPGSDTEGYKTTGRESLNVSYTSCEHGLTCTCCQSERKEESEIKTVPDMMEPVLSKVKTKPDSGTEGCESRGPLETKTVWVKSERYSDIFPVESEEPHDPLSKVKTEPDNTRDPNDTVLSKVTTESAESDSDLVKPHNMLSSKVKTEPERCERHGQLETKTVWVKTERLTDIDEIESEVPTVCTSHPESPLLVNPTTPQSSAVMSTCASQSSHSDVSVGQQERGTKRKQLNWQEDEVSLSQSQNSQTQKIFSDNELAILKKHQIFHSQMSEYFKMLPTNPNIDRPQQPRESLSFLKNIPNEPTVQEMDSFLEQKLVQRNTGLKSIQLPEICELINNSRNHEDLANILKQSTSVLEHDYPTSISRYLNLGLALEKAFWFVKNTGITWGDYVRSLNISETYSLKLRTLAYQFAKFPKFHKLDISLKELDRKSRSILQCMQKDEAFRLKWQN